MKCFHIFNKGQPYPSEQAAVEQQKVQNQLATISAKISEIKESINRKVYAFRVASVKGAGSKRDTRVSDGPGKNL